MKKIANQLLIITMLFIAAGGMCFSVLADEHAHERKKHHGIFRDNEDDDHHDEENNRPEHERKNAVSPVSNETYTKNCGSCHFAYSPGLLPSGSWDKILRQSNEHFGESIEMDRESERIISEYLQKNAAEYSSSEHSAKIIRGLGKETPLRITDIPYIIKEHHDLSPDVFKQKSVGAFSNCIACHTTADQGSYDDDSVKIPR